MTDSLDLINSKERHKEEINSEDTVRDTKVIRTSSLLDDISDDEDDAISRAKGREAALRYFDQLVADKLAEKGSSIVDKLDETLDRISQERQMERERLTTLHKRQRNLKKTTQQEPDHRLDMTVDGIFRRLHKLLQISRNKAGNASRRIGKWSNLLNAGMAKRTWPLTDLIKSKVGDIVAKLARREEKISDRFAQWVTRIDNSIDQSISRTTMLVRRVWMRWNHGREWAEKNKKGLLGSFAAASVLAATAAIIIGNMTAYEYLYNGKVLGIVEDQQDVYRTIDMIGDKLTLAYGAEINIDKEDDITFRKVVGPDLKIDDQDDVLNTFTYLKDMNANAYAIVVDGTQVAILDCEKTAENLLAEVQERFLSESDSIEYQTIGFAEQVEIKKFNTKIGNIDPEDTALEYMLTGAVEKKTHIVKSGETFNQIAQDYGLEPSELQLSNPDAKPANLHVGQELVLTQICPVVTVQTTEIATYTVAMDYEIAYQETSTLYKGEQTVKSRGIEGQREVVAEIVRNNGIEVSRNELSSKILSDPVSQVVLTGTKALPPLIGTGTFIYPTRGTLTSRFGPRWGRMHYGIDLAAPTGTKIRASDGGKVIYTGRDGSLGLVIRIDHGGNMTTVYGHCSKILVNVGDKVYQDQHIANVGNTGYSTGPHLHFEVRINGVAQNPLKYLQ